jgi:hypothetical protein
MNIKFLNVALGIVLAATTFSASAQKTLTSGTITMSGEAMGSPVEIKEYFTPDSAATSFSAGPATIKLLRTNNYSYLIVLVDVPVASMKKAGLASPDDIEQAKNEIPKFTYAPGTDTKQISGFNCKKVVATNTKDNKSYDVWITNDITLPAGVGNEYYLGIGGIPIQYTSFSQGKESSVTVTAITDAKAPAGTFAVSADYDKMSLDDLKAMSGGGN